jgi:hypothetical protein
MTEILFAGLGDPAVAVATPVENPPWFQAQEREFQDLTATEEGSRLYGDPARGATLAQVWRTHAWLNGYFPVCLLVAGRDRELSTSAIAEKYIEEAGRVLELLHHGFTLADHIFFQTLVYDGRSGHAIRLVGSEDSDTFIFHDPWPGRSLLCSENNAAGIDASERAERRWAIGDNDLEKVIVAAFVQPRLWAELAATT